jgi:hypothetical protein
LLVFDCVDIKHLDLALYMQWLRVSDTIGRRRRREKEV